jgi:hypothetical protein
VIFFANLSNIISLQGAKGAERKYFLFAVDLPSSRKGWDYGKAGRTANEKKSTLCALGAFAVKFKIIHLQRGQIIGGASVDYTSPYL